MIFQLNGKGIYEVISHFIKLNNFQNSTLQFKNGNSKLYISRIGINLIHSLSHSGEFQLTIHYTQGLSELATPTLGIFYLD